MSSLLNYCCIVFLVLLSHVFIANGDIDCMSGVSCPYSITSYNTVRFTDSVYICCKFTECSPGMYFTGEVKTNTDLYDYGDLFSVLIMRRRVGEKPECVNNCEEKHNGKWVATKEQNYTLGCAEEYYFGIKCRNLAIPCDMRFVNYKFNNGIPTHTPTPKPIHTITPEHIHTSTPTPQPIHTHIPVPPTKTPTPDSPKPIHTITPEHIHTNEPEPIHTSTPTPQPIHTHIPVPPTKTPTPVSPQSIPVWSGNYRVEPGCNKDVCCCIENIVVIAQDGLNLTMSLFNTCGNIHATAELSWSDYKIAFFNSSVGDYKIVLTEDSGVEFQNLQHPQCSVATKIIKPSPSPTPHKKHKRSPWPLVIVLLIVICIFLGLMGGLYLFRKHKIANEERPLLVVQ